MITTPRSKSTIVEYHSKGLGHSYLDLSRERCEGEFGEEPGLSAISPSLYLGEHLRFNGSSDSECSCILMMLSLLLS